MGVLTLRRKRDAEWSYRHGAASLRAKAIKRQATILGEDLVRLSQCEGDHQTALLAIQALLEELALAQRLVMEFDCVEQLQAAEY
jgi:hypothetical protein